MNKQVALPLVFEEFQLGELRTGEGCVIWATTAAAARIRFDIPRDVLNDTLDGSVAFPNRAAINLCKQNKEKIEAACQRALLRAPKADAIALITRDFQ